MRLITVIIALLASGLSAVFAESSTKPSLAFSITATNANFSRELSSDLVLRVERDGLGWEAGVFHRHSSDNLLYPKRIWHGAFSCQISAWSCRTKTFPNDREIPIRGESGSILIRLIDAKVIGKSGSEQFTEGRVEIYWKRDA